MLNVMQIQVTNDGYVPWVQGLTEWRCFDPSPPQHSFYPNFYEYIILYILFASVSFAFPSRNNFAMWSPISISLEASLVPFSKKLMTFDVS